MSGWRQRVSLDTVPDFDVALSTEVLDLQGRGDLDGAIQTLTRAIDSRDLTEPCELVPFMASHLSIHCQMAGKREIGIASTRKEESGRISSSYLSEGWPRWHRNQSSEGSASRPLLRRVEPADASAVEFGLGAVGPKLHV